VTAVEWLVTDIIEYVCSNPVLLLLFAVPVDVLEVIVKLDAFPVAGGHCFLLSVTFGNFGALCKASCLHFVAAIADCNDSDRDILLQVTKNNFAAIDALLAAGSMFVKALNRTIRIVINFGGDDKILRLIAGLEVSSSKWCCFYCFWRRKLPTGVPQIQGKRSVDMACTLAVEQRVGHQHQPFLKNLLWTAYKMCVLHALMSMGRLLCHWLHDWLVLLEQVTGITKGWDDTSKVWLKLLSINIDISKPPVNKSWNCKGKYFTCIHIVLTQCLGIYTARMWASFEVLAAYLHIPANVVFSVAQMRKAFKVLYLFDFGTEKAQRMLQWYKANIGKVTSILIVMSS
jgi:hypothetical protein